MNPLVALAAVDIVGALLLACIFGFLATRAGQTHLRRWTVAWGLLAVAQVLTANDLLGRPIPHLGILAPAFASAAVLFLIAGTRSFAGQRYSHVWTGVTVASGAGVLALEAMGVDPVPASTPVILVLVAAILSAALTLYRRSPGLASHRLAALALGLWALNSATYPVLGSIEAFKPMGLALSALLQIGTGIGLLLSHLDLASEALDRAAVRYRALIEHASVGVFQADSEGRLIVANPELAHILGHKDLETLREEGRLSQLWPSGETREGKQEYDRETIWQRPGGQRRRLRVHGSLTHRPDGVLEMVDGFVTDITEQRQEAEQRETALRLQAVGRLTGGIAHDFNNLLTVIIGNLELARSTGQASTIEDALEASDRASKLTRQLLTFARSQESEAETVDLVPQVTVLSRLLSRTLPECLTLTVDHEAPSCIAAIPASDLDQIVLNLVVNARDALGADQGRIRVSTRMEETEGECFAILLVADDGPGLDPSVRDSLFEPFVSTRDGDGGLGLGLSIVRDLVSRTGGRIDVRSDPVDGTCFEVRLPVTAPTGPAPALSDLPVEGDGTILVVDDDPAVRRTVTLILEGAGFRVIEASGLSEAQAALDPSLRAIVTDVLMQDGSGFDVLETVEQRKLAVPCILISGYPDQVTRHQGNVHASVPILSKPFRAQELLALLRERLHAR